MGRHKTEKYVIITPKSDNGKERISYHGERWIFREEKESLKFVRGGPFIGVVSSDGKVCLYIKKANDPDFDIRFLF